MNKKMKLHDSFQTLFPLYTHGDPSQIKLVPTETHVKFVYPERNDEGRPTHKINREFTCKKDFITEYHDAIIKVANMKRIYKAWPVNKVVICSERFKLGMLLISGFQSFRIYFNFIR